MNLNIGIDIGGTFTDFVILDPDSGRLSTFKILSTPSDPANAVLSGLKLITSSLENVTGQDDQLNQEPASSVALSIIHGSTVATNALLEHKGVPTALITTYGFRDVLQIGRQARPGLYDFFADPPASLVPAHLRYEVNERIDRDGNVITPFDIAELDPIVSQLRKQEIHSVAICLLFSFTNPDHERLIAGKLRSEGFSVSLSSEILPEFREYERTSTTVINAYVSPVLEIYLNHLESSLDGNDTESHPITNTGIRWNNHLGIMQSNGGRIQVSEARKKGVHCILSGPAGGVIGARYVSELTEKSAFHKSIGGKTRIITFDMGGTSTDVSLVDGDFQVTKDAIIGGYPIHIPMLDIHTIGAGGGSIAAVDAGGALRVGPESAGADPGPACYGLITPHNTQTRWHPTVTDANLILGRLRAEAFLGGKMPLHIDYAQQAFTPLAQRLGLSLMDVTLGTIDVVNAHMERALRLVSIERGYDPGGGGGEAPFTLVSFGGAGGLHAVELARRLSIPRVLIPSLASTLSALGMLASDIVKDYSQTIMLTGEIDPLEIDRVLNSLAEYGFSKTIDEGITQDQILIERQLDVRYHGQSFELTVPWRGSIRELSSDFHHTHHRAYGYERPETPLEIVNARVRVIGLVHRPTLPVSGIENASSPQVISSSPERYPVLFSKEVGIQLFPFYNYQQLKPGSLLPGPAIILASDTTILLGPSDQAIVDEYMNLVITVNT